MGKGPTWVETPAGARIVAPVPGFEWLPAEPVPIGSLGAMRRAVRTAGHIEIWAIHASPSVVHAAASDSRCMSEQSFAAVGRAMATAETVAAVFDSTQTEAGHPYF
jgi:hypothetical protein